MCQRQHSQYHWFQRKLSFHASTTININNKKLAYFQFVLQQLSHMTRRQHLVDLLLPSSDQERVCDRIHRKIGPCNGANHLVVSIDDWEELQTKRPEDLVRPLIKRTER